MIDDVIKERLQQSVPELGNRVENVAALSVLMRQDVTPHETPAAYLIPLGLDGGPADIISGAYRQMLTVQWGVMLVISYAGDLTGSVSWTDVGHVARSIRHALAGFQPDDDGILVLKRERLVEIKAGTIFYQLDFAVDEQLRIIS
jgi:hypothetical protein